MSNAEKKLPDVVVVPEDVNIDELGEFLSGNGPIPAGSYLESYEKFSARGRVEDCDCGLIQCACAQTRPHDQDCSFRIAMTCAVPINCEPHGVYVCPICDVCDCNYSKS